MNVKTDPSLRKTSQPSFDCCIMTASFIFSLLACFLTATLITFWIMKSSNGFNSCPYSIISSCSSAYFITKYSNQILPLVIFVAMIIAGVSQATLAIFYLCLLYKKSNPTSGIKALLGVFSSLGGISAIIPSAFTASFLLEMPRFVTYGCTVNSDQTVLLILCISACSALLSHLIQHTFLLKDFSGNKIFNEQQKEFNVPPNHITDEPLFGPQVREREKILYRRSHITETKKIEHDFQGDNNSFSELKSPSYDNKSGISKTHKTQISKRHEYLDNFIYQEESQKSSKEEQLPVRITRKVIRNPRSIKIQPELKELREYEQEEEMSDDISNQEIVETSFVPNQNFAYPRNSRTPNNNYPLKRNSKSYKTPQYREFDDDILRTEQYPIMESRRKSKTPARLQRAIGQINKNYERRLNLWQNPSRP